MSQKLYDLIKPMIIYSEDNTCQMSCPFHSYFPAADTHYCQLFKTDYEAEKRNQSCIKMFGEDRPVEPNIKYSTHKYEQIEGNC